MARIDNQPVRRVDVAETPLEFAVTEIYNSYGDQVALRRKSLHKFGRNANVGTTEEDINHLGIEPVHSTTNSITTFSSANAADTQTLRVEGMILNGNDDFQFSAQNITLTGQTQGTLTTPLARVTRIANVASTTATLGDVYVYEAGTATGGIPNNLSTVGNVMVAVDQTTMFAGTSVAANNYFVCTGFFAYLASGSPQGASANIRLKVRDKDSVYRTVNIITIGDTHGSEHMFTPHLIIPPNSDIDLVATSDQAGGADVVAGFHGYFADIL